MSDYLERDGYTPGPLEQAEIDAEVDAQSHEGKKNGYRVIDAGTLRGVFSKEVGFKPLETNEHSSDMSAEGENAS